MVMVLTGAGMGSAATGGVGMAGASTGTAVFPGAGSRDGDWEEDNISYPGSGSGSRQGNGGFYYQGKQYDPILNEPMVVSAETHGDLVHGAFSLWTLSLPHPIDKSGEI